MEHRQQTRVYRGIKLADSVSLYKMNGEYKTQVKNGLDKFVNLLEENCHILLSKYVGVMKKVKIDFCCGHEPHCITPDKYQQGRGCPKCSNHCPIQAKEDFFRMVELNGHFLLSEYEKTHEKVKIDFCCGHEPHCITPSNYKNGVKCPECAKISLAENQAKQAKDEFPLLVNQYGHILLSEYRNAHIKVRIDFKCGHEPRWIKPNDYKNGTRCSECSGTCPIQAENIFIELIKQNGHVLLGNYRNAFDKVRIDFKCGHEPGWMAPHDYKKGRGCLECKYIEQSKRQFEQAKAEFPLIVESNGHVLLNEYKGNKIKTLINFKCGHEPHLISPNDYKNGIRCPQCSESKGEKIIREYLEENNIVYSSQYKFPNSRKIYDFMLPFENTIVEINGLQHYAEVDFSGKGKGRTLAQEQANDKAKQEFAESFGFKYIIVDYREGKPELAFGRFIEAYNNLKEQTFEQENVIKDHI